MRALETIRAEMETKRAVMVELGMTIGFCHPETVDMSQQVDKLHNEYMRAERSAATMREAQSA